MKKITLILLSLSLLANVALAQVYIENPLTGKGINVSTESREFHSAELVDKNGEIRSGFVKVPSIGDKEIKFKNNQEDDDVKIKSDELRTITFKLENGDSHTLERCETSAMYTKKSGEVKTVKIKGEIWLYRKYTHEKMNYYVAGLDYYIHKNGKEFYVASVHKKAILVELRYYMRRASEKECAFITADAAGINVNYEKGFRNAASTYLSDNKELADRIKNKEFKRKDLEEIYKIYISD